MQYLEKKQKPKIVFLYNKGAIIAKKYSRDTNSIYSSITLEEQAKVLSCPNQDQARQALRHATLRDYRGEQVGESNQLSHPQATTTKLSLTSTCFIIVSMSSLQLRCIYAEQNNVEARKSKKYRDLITIERKLNLCSTKQRREAKEAISAYLDRQLQKNRLGVDRYSPMQAKQKFKLKNSQQGRKVINLTYAAIIFINKLHSTASANTITYNQIINPIIYRCSPLNLPRVVGITSTALTNRISLALTFADKVISRVATPNSTNKGVRTIARFSKTNFTTA